jgi:hypothetical protein
VHRFLPNYLIESVAPFQLPQRRTNEGCQQGDQIGRIFARWAFVHFGHSFENYSSSKKIGLLFYAVKWYWATFWAIFHQLIWSPWLSVDEIEAADN